MTIAEICHVDVDSLAADDAVLFIWVCPGMDEPAFRVLTAWGDFTLQAKLYWAKDAAGGGLWVRNQVEELWCCTRGTVSPPDEENTPTGFLEARRPKHGTKPGEVYGMIDKMIPWARKVELFAGPNPNRPANWAAGIERRLSSGT
jgi:N6-adenosine-specific RNA methylase IME4